jgi:hypothetical protein
MAIPSHISRNPHQYFGEFNASHRRFTKISLTLLPMATHVYRFGISAALAALLSASLISPVAADDGKSKPKPSSKIEMKNSKEKFESDEDAYKTAIKDREEARELINETFKSAIKKATSDAKNGLVAATTAEQKLMVMNNLKNARTTAVAIRDAALAALGTFPTPPAAPKKDAKGRTLAP